MFMSPDMDLYWITIPAKSKLDQNLNHLLENSLVYVERASVQLYNKLFLFLFK